MGFIRDFADSVKATAVATKIESLLKKFDENRLVDIATTNSEFQSEMMYMGALILKDIIKETKTTIVKLSKDNADEIIELKNHLESVIDILNKMNNDKNKETFKELKDRITEIGDSKSEYIETVTEKYEQKATEAVEQMFPETDFSEKYYIIGLSGNVEVSKEKFEEYHKLHSEFSYERRGRKIVQIKGVINSKDKVEFFASLGM